MKQAFLVMTGLWVGTLSGAAWADMVIDDGLVHAIDYAVDEPVRVYDATATGNPSSVMVSAGAEFASTVELWDHSQLTMSGGIVRGDLLVRDGASASTHGGQVMGMIFAVDDAAMVIAGCTEVGACFILNDARCTIEGEAVVGRLEMMDSSSVDIRGGQFGEVLLGGGAARISGGLFQEDVVFGSAEASVSGGTFAANAWIGGTLNVYGGAFGGEVLLSTPAAAVTLFGGDFAINGAPVALGSRMTDYELTRSEWNGWSCLTGVVTGTLADGTPVNQSIRLLSTDEISYGDVYFIPEPASLWLLLAGGWVLRSGGRRSMRRLG